MTTKERDRQQFNAEMAQQRKDARAKFGERNVTDVLLRARQKLHMLRGLAWAQAEADADGSELSQDGWNGLADALDELLVDVTMLDDALPADVHNWRPGKDELESGVR